MESPRPRRRGAEGARRGGADAAGTAAGCPPPGSPLRGARTPAESELGGRLLEVALSDNMNLRRHRPKLGKVFPSARVEATFTYVA